MANTDNSNKFWWQIRVLVFSGLIVAALTTAWLTDTLHYFGSIIATGARDGMAALVWFFTASYALPVWAIAVLAFLSLAMLYRLYRKWYESTEGYKTSYERYTSDTIFGVDWTWGYLSGRPAWPRPYCPHDATPMAGVFTHDRFSGQETVWYECETCKHESSRLQVSRQNYLEAVLRQIEGKINRKEYLSRIAPKSS